MLGGCRIERTPDPYIDRLETPQEEVRASAEELIDLLLSTAASLQRGNLGAVAVALAPDADLSGIGPGAAVITGYPEFLDSLSAMTANRSVDMVDLKVEVEPRNAVAWFRSVLVLTGDSIEAERMPFTGVFVHEEGVWHLRQAHLSGPISSQPDSLPQAPDSAVEGG